MIIGKITAKAQTTIPRVMRLASCPKPGDDAVLEIDGDNVALTRSRSAPDPFVGNLDCFTEWASDADCQAFDQH